MLTKPRPNAFVRRLAAAGHRVHLLMMVPSEAALAELPAAPGWPAVADACADVSTVVLPPWRSLARTALSLPTPMPLRVAYCRSRRLVELASRIVERSRIDIVHVDRERLGSSFRRLRSPWILDATDSISLYLGDVVRHGPIADRVVSAVELPKLRRYERTMADGASYCLVTTDRDHSALAAAGCRTPLETLPNGVSDDLLDLPRAPNSDAIVFVGNLSYTPNVAGIRWFVSKVLPRIRSRVPAARLVLAGASPPAAVRRLTRVPGIELHDNVPDVGGFLAGARVFVSPLRIGGGFPNKVAEALAAGVPTVATPAAYAGIRGLRAGEHLLEAPDAEMFAHETVRLLTDDGLAERLSASARDFARTRLGWDASVTRLEAIYRECAAGLPVQSPRDRVTT